MKYSAIDLHSNNKVLVVTDETDRVLVEKRLPNELNRVLELLAPYKDELVGVVAFNLKGHGASCSPLVETRRANLLKLRYGWTL